jgi:hypothetical protein
MMITRETSPTSMRCIAALWRGKEGAFTLNTGELVFGIEPTTKHRCIPPLKKRGFSFWRIDKKIKFTDK